MVLASPAAAQHNALPPAQVRAPTAVEQTALDRHWRSLQYYQQNGGHANALDELARFLPAVAATYGPQHVLSTYLELRRALALAQTGKHTEAEAAYERHLPALIAQLGENHGWVFESRQARLTNLAEMGRLAEAESALAPLLAQLRRETVKSELASASADANLAWLRLRQGRFRDAEPLARAAVEKRVAAAAEPGTVASARGLLVEALTGLGRTSEALSEADQGLAVAGPASIGKARLLVAQGEAHAALGDHAKASAAMRAGAEMLVEKAGFDAPETVSAASRARFEQVQLGLGRVLLEEKLPQPVGIECKDSVASFAQFYEALDRAATYDSGDDAVQCYARAADWAAKLVEGSHPLHARALAALAKAEFRRGSPDAAERHAREALAQASAVFGAEHPITRGLAVDTAQALGAQGQARAAETLLAGAGKGDDRAALLARLAEAERLDAALRPGAAGRIWEELVTVPTDRFGTDLTVVARLLGGAFANRKARGICPTADETKGLIELVQQRKKTWEYISKRDALDEAGAIALACRGDWKGADAAYQEIATQAFASARGFQNPAWGLVEARRALLFAQNPATLPSAEQAARNARFVALERRYTADRDAAGKPLGRLRIGTNQGGTDALALGHVAAMEVAWARQGRQPAGAADFSGFEAFQAAQDLALSGAAQSLLLAAAREGASDPALRDLIGRQQKAIDAWNAADQAALAGSSGDPATETRLKALAAERERLTEELTRKFPEYAALVRPLGLSVTQVQERLKPGEGLLLVQPARDAMFVFAVSPDGFAWQRSALSASDTEAKVARLRCMLDGATCTTEKPADMYDLGTAKALYDGLIAPVGQPLSGVRTLYTVTGGALGAMPLAALPLKPGNGADEVARLAATEWLADRHALVTLPSVSALRAYERAAATYKAALVGFGDPALGPPQDERVPDPAQILPATRGALADVKTVAEMPSLPWTRTELSAVAQALSAPSDALHLGAAATEGLVKRLPGLSDARVVMFSTHGLLPNELAGFSEAALVLTPPAVATPLDDGLLTASEIARLRLSADWVVLSACNTAGAGEPGGESLSGLARAFLFAGARSILVSHWQIGDQVAAALTSETLRIRAARPELGRAAALAAAMKGIRSGTSLLGGTFPGWRSDWADPWVWAPFTLVETED